MGIWDTITGNDAADAAKAAAADTYAKQQAATNQIRGYGDQYAAGLRDLSKGFQPFVNTGVEATNSLLQLLRDPSSIRSLPGYQSSLGEGVKAIDRSAASNGTLFSGRTGKALQDYGINLADKTQGDWLSRLLGVSQQGLGATTGQIGTIGQGLTGQLGARTSAYAGDMNSAGTIGQGDIAAANAKAQGWQNLLNVAANGVGTAMGAKGGSSYGPGNLIMGGGSPTGYGR